MSSVENNIYDNIIIWKTIPEKQRRNCYRIFIAVFTPRENTIVGFAKRILKSTESLEIVSPSLAYLLRKRRSREKIAYRIHALHHGQYGYYSAILGILRNVAAEDAIDLQLPKSLLKDFPTPRI